MTITHLKQAKTCPVVEGKGVRGILTQMLAKIEEGGETAVRDYARDLDGWTEDRDFSKKSCRLCGCRKT